jgi:hypothetical protein
MIYTSKVNTVVKGESFKLPDGVTMNKYTVTFANGHNPNVYSPKELTFTQGDEVEYDLDQNKNKAKILGKKSSVAPTAAPAPKGNYSNPKDDVQRYIIRQSSLNRATDLYAGKEINTTEIINLARTFENYVFNG